MAAEIDSFIGLGVTSPFRRGANDFASVSGVEQTRNQVAQVLGTERSTQNSHGELKWRGSFGSRLHLLRHRKNNLTLRELARVYAVEALGVWVPTVRVTEVETFSERGPDGAKNILRIRVKYDILKVARQGSKVIYQGIVQDVVLGA